MNPLDRNLDGFCVRGLPIGKPFRTKFEVTKDYDASFTDTTDVFILLRYKDMQGGEVIDLLPEAERQELPSETKENTLKRRILNRQNIINEKPTDKHASDTEDVYDSDIESVTIEDILELHIDSETGNSYYTDPTNSHTAGVFVESDFKSISVFDTSQVVEEVKGELTELDEETLTGTDKIIHALVNRETSDKNTTNDEDDYDDYLYNANSGSVIRENDETKTVRDKSTGMQDKDNNILEQKYVKTSLRHSKRKIEEETAEVNRVKVKKIDETENNESRRVSQRLQTAGHKTDFEAMVKTNDNKSNDGGDDDTDDYDVDNEKTKETAIKKKSKQRKKSKHTVLKNKSEPNNNDEDVKPDLNKLNAAIKIKISSSHHKSESHKGKTFKRCRNRLGKRKGNSRTSCSVKINNIEDRKEQKSRKQSNHIPDSELENEIANDPNDPDFELTDVEQDGGNEKESETTVEKSKGSVRKKCLKNETDSVSKPKQGRKTKEMKANNSKGGKTDDDDSSLIESDPDLVGLAPYKRNILMAKRKKIMEQQEKQATRIKVKLHEHTDKWKREVMDSYMRKDRGKARYEVAVEMYMCTVCDKYKAESKESMETHIEMHVNGDLQCNHPNCTYIAVTNFELQKHKRDIHKKNIWICDICGLETIGREGLKDHLGKVHDSPQWSCKLCLENNDTKFASVTLHEHKKHLRVAHPESMYRCDGCKRLFAQKHKLDNHLKLGCEGEGRKEFPCEKCGKVFSSQDSVKRHIMRVHNKERSFQCPYCPFTAARQTNLTSHLNVHDGKFYCI